MNLRDAKDKASRARRHSWSAGDSTSPVATLLQAHRYVVEGEAHTAVDRLFTHSPIVVAQLCAMDSSCRALFAANPYHRRSVVMTTLVYNPNHGTANNKTRDEISIYVQEQLQTCDPAEAHWTTFMDPAAVRDRIEVNKATAAFLQPYYLQFFNFTSTQELCKGITLAREINVQPQHLIFNRGSLNSPNIDSPYPNRDALSAINSVFFLYTEPRLRPKGISLLANDFYGSAVEFYNYFEGLAPLARLVFYGPAGRVDMDFDMIALLHHVYDSAITDGTLRYVSLSRVTMGEPMDDVVTFVLEAFIAWLVYGTHYPPANSQYFPHHHRINNMAFRNAAVGDLKYLAITYGFFGRVENEDIQPEWLKARVKPLGDRITEEFASDAENSDAEEHTVTRAQRAAHFWHFAWRYRRYDNVGNNNHVLSFLRPDGYVFMFVIRPSGEIFGDGAAAESTARLWHEFQSVHLNRLTGPNNPLVSHF